MKYTKLRPVSAEVFHRITGVKKKTFAAMLAILIASDKKRLKGAGRPPILSIEEQLLMTLEYLREYRTYAHIGIDYGVGESSAFRII